MSYNWKEISSEWIKKIDCNLEKKEKENFYIEKNLFFETSLQFLNNFNNNNFTKIVIENENNFNLIYNLLSEIISIYFQILHHYFSLPSSNSSSSSQSFPYFIQLFETHEIFKLIKSIDLVYSKLHNTTELFLKNHPDDLPQNSIRESYYSKLLEKRQKNQKFSTLIKKYSLDYELYEKSNFINNSLSHLLSFSPTINSSDFQFINKTIYNSYNQLKLDIYEGFFSLNMNFFSQSIILNEKNLLNLLELVEFCLNKDEYDLNLFSSLFFHTEFDLINILKNNINNLIFNKNFINLYKKIFKKSFMLLNSKFFFNYNIHFNEIISIFNCLLIKVLNFLSISDIILIFQDEKTLLLNFIYEIYSKFIMKNENFSIDDDEKENFLILFVILFKVFLPSSSIFYSFNIEILENNVNLKDYNEIFDKISLVLIYLSYSENSNDDMIILNNVFHYSLSLWKDFNYFDHILMDYYYYFLTFHSLIDSQNINNSKFKSVIISKFSNFHLFLINFSNLLFSNNQTPIKLNQFLITNSQYINLIKYNKENLIYYYYTVLLFSSNNIYDYNSILNSFKSNFPPIKNLFFYNYNQKFLFLSPILSFNSFSQSISNLSNNLLSLFPTYLSLINFNSNINIKNEINYLLKYYIHILFSSKISTNTLIQILNLFLNIDYNLNSNQYLLIYFMFKIIHQIFNFNNEKTSKKKILLSLLSENIIESIKKFDIDNSLDEIFLTSYENISLDQANLLKEFLNYFLNQNINNMNQIYKENFLFSFHIINDFLFSYSKFSFLHGNFIINLVGDLIMNFSVISDTQEYFLINFINFLQYFMTEYVLKNNMINLDLFFPLSLTPSCFSSTASSFSDLFSLSLTNDFDFYNLNNSLLSLPVILLIRVTKELTLLSTSSPTLQNYINALPSLYIPLVKSSSNILENLKSKSNILLYKNYFSNYSSFSEIKKIFFYQFLTYSISFSQLFYYYYLYYFEKNTSNNINLKINTEEKDINKIEILQMIENEQANLLINFFFLYSTISSFKREKTDKSIGIIENKEEFHELYSQNNNFFLLNHFISPFPFFKHDFSSLIDILYEIYSLNLHKFLDFLQSINENIEDHSNFLTYHYTERIYLSSNFIYLTLYSRLNEVQNDLFNVSPSLKISINFSFLIKFIIFNFITLITNLSLFSLDVKKNFQFSSPFQNLSLWKSFIFLFNDKNLESMEVLLMNYDDDNNCNQDKNKNIFIREDNDSFFNFSPLLYNDDSVNILLNDLALSPSFKRNLRKNEEELVESLATSLFSDDSNEGKFASENTEKTDSSLQLNLYLINSETSLNNSLNKIIDILSNLSPNNWSTFVPSLSNKYFLQFLQDKWSNLLNIYTNYSLFLYNHDIFLFLNGRNNIIDKKDCLISTKLEINNNLWIPQGKYKNFDS